MKEGELTLSEYIKAMNGFMKTIEDMTADIDELRQGAETHHSPFKIGDIITVKGYSHTGKLMEVRSVKLAYSWGGWHWEARGAVIKKDGTPSEVYKGYTTEDVAL